MPGRLNRTGQLRLQPCPMRQHKRRSASRRSAPAWAAIASGLWLALSQHSAAQLPAASSSSWPPTTAAAAQLDPLIYLQRADGSLRCLTRDQTGRWWAVGNRGLILTSDHGANWFAETAKTSHPLSAIAFATDQRRSVIGWAVGGWYEAFSGTSRAVVLKKAGSQSDWEVVAAPDGLPRLTGIQPINDQLLIAWGDWSTAWDASLFTSQDGGRSWRPKIGRAHV